MIYQKFLQTFLAFALMALPLLSHGQDADAKNGKALFLKNCASCHAVDMKTKSTGPALGDLESRWTEYPREDLYAWIRNSQALINEGHPRAEELWAEWKPTVMNNFLQLKDQEIEDLLLFIKNKYEQGCAEPPCQEAVAATTSAAGDDGSDDALNMTYLIILTVVLGLLALVLTRIISNLNRLAKIRAGETPAAPKSLLETLTSKPIVTIAVFALVILGGYTVVDNAIALGRQQGYAPDQPIKFSHELHAGQNEIDCQYCHDGARRSKHAVIPATNTCLNCHKAIQKGPEYGTAEILKIYVSSGFNPESGQYFAENVSEEARKEVFKKWLAGQNEDASAEELEMQLAAALPMADQPVEWIRIHNLPDHVYFNHSQHVVAGGIECQTCHGPIEEMKKVAQYAPLSMGWCINCHRETEVQFKDNDYYKSYEKYHEELATGERSKVTVEDIGGLECQKCHY